MRGALSLSPDLEKVVEALTPEYLDSVVKEALAYVRNEYVDDEEIIGAIDALSLTPEKNPDMVNLCRQLSQMADDSYFELEQAGQAAASAHQFRRMCVFNGLLWLFLEDEFTPRLVDEMLYDLGHGSGSTDDYVAQLIERLTQSD